MELWLEVKEAGGCIPAAIDHYRREVTRFGKRLIEEDLNVGPDDAMPSHMHCGDILLTGTLYSS